MGGDVGAGGVWGGEGGIGEAGVGGGGGRKGDNKAEYSENTIKGEHAKIIILQSGLPHPTPSSA